MIGYIAILIGLLGIWLAARHVWGWLLGVGSAIIWIVWAIQINQKPILVSASLNGLILLRNFIRVYRDKHKPKATTFKQYRGYL